MCTQAQLRDAEAAKHAAETRYAQLRERHSAARVEFDKLKVLASERKRAALELQRQVRAEVVVCACLSLCWDLRVRVL